MPRKKQLTRSDWALACRALLGTRYVHAGRLPMDQDEEGKGGKIDCGGVVVCAAQSLGVKVTDRINYGQASDRGPVTEQIASSFADEFEGELEDCDFAAVEINNSPFHVLAVIPGGRMVHIRYGLKVREEPLSSLNPNRILKMWTVRGISR